MENWRKYYNEERLHGQSARRRRLRCSHHIQPAAVMNSEKSNRRQSKLRQQSIPIAVIDRRELRSDPAPWHTI